MGAVEGARSVVVVEMDLGGSGFWVVSKSHCVDGPLPWTYSLSCFAAVMSWGCGRGWRDCVVVDSVNGSGGGCVVVVSMKASIVEMNLEILGFLLALWATCAARPLS